MRTRKMIMVLVLVALAAAGLMAADLSGRDVADSGTLASISGTLDFVDSEWYLVSAGTTYELHMGVIGHEGGHNLVAGADADAYGFVLPGHIAPISITCGAETDNFWTEDRMPLWAGKGNLQNARSENPGNQTLADDKTRLLRNQADRPGRGRI